MEITNIILVFLALTLPVQLLNVEENNAEDVTKPPFNPLEGLILNQNPNGMKDKPLSRVKRQYGYYPDYYPVPIIIGGFGGFGGYGGGFGRGFGGRGFGGGGFGGGGFGGGGFGGRGFGGRGFGGRGFGGRGFGGRGFGGRGFGGRGGGFGGGRGGRG